MTTLGYTAQRVMEHGKRWRICRERTQIGGLFGGTSRRWVAYYGGLFVFETGSSVLTFQIVYYLDRAMLAAAHAAAPIELDPDADP